MDKNCYSELVYRSARICEVSDPDAKSKDRLKLYYNQAEKVTNIIHEKRHIYFDKMNELLSQRYPDAKLEYIEDGETRTEYREGPIVVFPNVDIRIGEDIFRNRNCNTVCMGNNRSKLWVRISLNRDFKNAKEVLDCYSKSGQVVDIIGESVFKCYKSILNECDFDVKQVYNISVLGVGSRNLNIAESLQKLHNPDYSMLDAFKENSILFDCAKDVVFPLYGLEQSLTDVKDYDPQKMEKYHWLSVDDEQKGALSVFLMKHSNGDDKKAKRHPDGSTRFAGFGYIVDPDRKTMQKATRDILSLLSPNL